LNEKRLALFIRYETTHERAFYRALKELQTLRKEKRNTEIGFESQKLKQAAETRAAEALNLKREALEFKKAVVEMKNAANQTKKGVRPPVENSPDGQEMVA
jgi:methylmalonyl-CoA mutase N-terminal domain/subunit